LQILLVLLRLVVTGERVPQVTAALGEQITPFLPSLQWVPHHVSGVPAAWCGFLILIEVIRRVECADSLSSALRANVAALLVASAALASAAGLTVWVTMGAAAIAGLWGLVLLWEQRGKALCALTIAGLAALALCAPDLIDMVQNRVPQPQATLGLFIRPISLVELLAWTLRVVTGDYAPIIIEHPLYAVIKTLINPLGYFLDAGLFFVGTVLFWRARWRLKGSPWFRGETDRLLFISMVATLMIGQFVKSTVLNNDLGWRVPLFAQMAALVWTAHVARPLWKRAVAAFHAGGLKQGLSGGLKHTPRLITAVAVLGIVANAYDIMGLRLYPLLGTDDLRNTEFDADLARDLRTAHTWLATAVPLTAVTQHNPGGHRAIGSGLYGHQRVAFSDRHNAQIFGASKSMVRERFAILDPVFNQSRPAADVKSRLQSVKTDLVFVTHSDPAWISGAPWVFETTPLFATSRLRVIDVHRLGQSIAANVTSR
jgi:hypothetical protein